MGTPPVIVVGAGVAGCVGAATAIELGFSVTVHEAGPAGPLPESLRSADLNRASEAVEWWWPDPYLAGRGVGGGSAVNGMVVQRPDHWDSSLQWAWEGFDPVQVAHGPLAGLLSDSGVPTEEVWLSLSAGQRRTAADIWLKPHPRLSIESDSEVDHARVVRWVEDGSIVLVAAGALRSPALVGAESLAPQDHRSAVVGFGVPDELQIPATDAPVAAGLIRGDGFQLLLIERAGPDPANGALIVSAMVDDPDSSVLGRGVDYAIDVLSTAGLTGEVVDGPAPVAHACCTLTGVETIANVIDASTLPDLPNVNPMLTIAAHARHKTLSLLEGSR